MLDAWIFPYATTEDQKGVSLQQDDATCHAVNYDNIISKKAMPINSDVHAI